ncbi:MAG TPA: hypothetical protein VLZ53_12410, partial [Devosia sp.]|nr:hypothetical protein [Devosia sp.]
GFRDVGGREETWLDDQDRELVLHDHRKDAIIFRIKEKRGGRSKILLDRHGKMVEYVAGSGVLPLPHRQDGKVRICLQRSMTDRFRQPRASSTVAAPTNPRA